MSVWNHLCVYVLFSYIDSIYFFLTFAHIFISSLYVYVCTTHIESLIGNKLDNRNVIQNPEVIFCRTVWCLSLSRSSTQPPRGPSPGCTLSRLGLQQRLRHVFRRRLRAGLPDEEEEEAADQTDDRERDEHRLTVFVWDTRQHESQDYISTEGNWTPLIAVNAQVAFLPTRYVIVAMPGTVYVKISKE